MTKTLNKKELLNNPKYIVPISYNILFHELFGKKENADITAFLISALLDIPYEDVKGKIDFKDRTVNKNTISSKHGEKDVLFTVEVSEPLCISLEMNLRDLTDIKINRNVYFHSDTFSTSLKESNSYKKIPKTIQFNFNYSYVNTKDKPLIDTFLYRDEFGWILTEKSQIVHVNVAEMRDMWYNGDYQKRSDISPIVFLLSAIIVEFEKKKFDKLLQNKLVDREILEKIGDVVYSMNEKRDFKQEYYDFMQEQRELWRDEIEEIKEKMEKQYAEEFAEKYKKQEENMTKLLTENITKQVTEDVTKQVTEDVTKQVTEDVTKQVTEDVTKQVTEQTYRDIIFKMYEKGFDTLRISKLIDFNLQDVENIIKENNHNSAKSK